MATFAARSAPAVPVQRRGPEVLLRLDGFEGPLDLLLELARAQRVDLTRLSMPRLVDQYLDAVADLAGLDLTLAGDWLVTATWLVLLRSRLLLPADAAEAREAAAEAQAMAAGLVALDRLRAAAAFLARQPQLGRDGWGQGLAEELEGVVAARADVPSETARLFRACLTVLRAGLGVPTLPARYRAPLPLWDAEAARERLLRRLRELPAGSPLVRFVPRVADGAPERPLRRRLALAGTFVAALELARSGALILEQEVAFGPIRLRTTVEVGQGEVREPA